MSHVTRSANRTPSRPSRPWRPWRFKSLPPILARFKKLPLILATFLAPSLAALPAFAHARHPRTTHRDKTTWDSIFTDSQATRGQAAYNSTCARCHLESMAGADQSPALTGSGFMSSWNGATLAELHERIRTSMPSDTPGQYGRQHVTDVMAYMLKVNGFPAGAAELTHENDALKGIRFVSTRP